jgi:hypothetical protein
MHEKEKRTETGKRKERKKSNKEIKKQYRNNHQS